MELKLKEYVRQLETVVAPAALRYFLLVIPAWLLCMFAIAGLRELVSIPEWLVGLAAYGLFIYALAVVYATAWTVYPRQRLLQAGLTLLVGGWEFVLIWCVWRVLDPLPDKVIPANEGPWLLGALAAIVAGMLTMIPAAMRTPRVHIQWGNKPDAPVWEYDDS
jgi:hypothetical protein